MIIELPGWLRLVCCYRMTIDILYRNARRGLGPFRPAVSHSIIGRLRWQEQLFVLFFSEVGVCSVSSLTGSLSLGVCLLCAGVFSRLAVVIFFFIIVVAWLQKTFVLVPLQQLHLASAAEFIFTVGGPERKYHNAATTRRA